MRKVLIALIFVCFTVLQGCNDDSIDLASGFQGQVAWKKSMGGSSEDIFRKVIATTDGGMAAFGYTSSTDGDVDSKSREGRDFWLVKMAKGGIVEWTKTFGGSGDDRGRDFIQTADGGYAIVGYSKSADGDGSNNEGQHDNWILKTDAKGNIEWEQSYGFAGHDHAYAVVQMEDGGFAMGGFLDIDASEGKGKDGRNRHGIGEFWVHRLNTDGTIKWRRFFGGTNNDRIHAMLKSNDGGLILIGFTESNDFDITFSHGEYEFWAVKVDGEGNMVWQQTYGGSGIDIAYGAVNTSDNGYIIAGSTVSNDGDIAQNNGGTDAWLVKIDDSGAIVWERSYGGSDFDAAHGICPSKDGGFWVTGNTRSTDMFRVANQGENDAWIFKIDENGNQIWQKTLGGSEIDLGYDVLETTDGNPIFVGVTESNNGDIDSNQGMQDAWMVQLK